MMLAELLKTDSAQFGVVLIERGREVGGGEQRFGVGTLAEITQLGAQEGFVGLVAQGGRRFAVERWLADAPHPWAEVSELPDLVWDPGLAELRERHRAAGAADAGGGQRVRREHLAGRHRAVRRPGGGGLAAGGHRPARRAGPGRAAPGQHRGAAAHPGRRADRRGRAWRTRRRGRRTRTRTEAASAAGAARSSTGRSAGWAASPGGARRPGRSAAGRPAAPGAGSTAAPWSGSPPGRRRCRRSRRPTRRRAPDSPRSVKTESAPRAMTSLSPTTAVGSGPDSTRWLAALAPEA